MCIVQFPFSLLLKSDKIGQNYWSLGQNECVTLHMQLYHTLPMENIVLYRAVHTGLTNRIFLEIKYLIQGPKVKQTLL